MPQRAPEMGIPSAGPVEKRQNCNAAPSLGMGGVIEQRELCDIVVTIGSRTIDAKSVCPNKLPGKLVEFLEGDQNVSASHLSHGRVT